MAKEVVSSEDLPHLSCPFQLWLTLELHKGHYLNALAAEAWGEVASGGERTMTWMLPHTAGWLTSSLLLLSPVSLSPENRQSVSKSFRMLQSAVHNCALGLDY